MSLENSTPAVDSLSSSPQKSICWPQDGSLTREWIDDLTSTFEWSSRNLLPSELPSVLPFDVLQRLVLTASNILHQEPNCIHIDPPAGDEARGGCRVVVVGDVHGQLHDVLFLLRDAGFPSEECIFVFNGDYVDRGAWGLETFLLLLAWKLIIRSHEGPDARDKRHDMNGIQDGYSIDHEVDSGKLITLFSAPDYPQFQAADVRYNNRGAYIVLQPPDFATPEFHTFEAVKPRPEVNAYYDFKEVIDSDEELDLESMDHGSVASI